MAEEQQTITQRISGAVSDVGLKDTDEGFSAWGLIAIGLLLLATQTLFIQPFIIESFRTGKEPDRYRIEYVSYIDDNENGRYDAEGKDLNDDGDFEDEDEYDKDTLIEDPDDVPSGKNVSTAIVTSPLKRDTGILAAHVVFMPLIWTFVLMAILREEDAPLRIALWIGVGFAAPIIIYTILLLVISLVLATASQALGFVGGAITGVAGFGGNLIASGINGLTESVTGQRLIDDTGPSNSIDNAADGGTEPSEASQFLDTQWDTISVASGVIFASIISVILVFWFIGSGVKRGETALRRWYNGFGIGMVTQLVLVFVAFPFFGVV